MFFGNIRHFIGKYFQILEKSSLNKGNISKNPAELEKILRLQGIISNFGNLQANYAILFPKTWPWQIILEIFNVIRKYFSNPMAVSILDYFIG